MDGIHPAGLDSGPEAAFSALFFSAFGGLRPLNGADRESTGATNTEQQSPSTCDRRATKAGGSRYVRVSSGCETASGTLVRSMVYGGSASSLLSSAPMAPYAPFSAEPEAECRFVQESGLAATESTGARVSLGLCGFWR